MALQAVPELFAGTLECDNTQPQLEPFVKNSSMLVVVRVDQKFQARDENTCLEMQPHHELIG